MNRTFVFVLLTAAFCATAADAELRISDKATAHVSCSAGVCTANRAAASLNVADLIAMLNTADLTVSTGTAATDIRIANALSWASTHKLTLNAPQGSIVIEAPVVDQGGGALEFNRAGHSPCSDKGKVAFWDTATDFKIGGQQVTLVSSVMDLGHKASENPNGFYALANDYDAAADGLYRIAPVAFFEGRFDGLCNTIQHLKIHANATELGLFGESINGELTNIRLKNVSVNGNGNSDVGGLAGHTSDLITNTVVTGHVSAGSISRIGLVVGNLSGELDGVTASGKVVGRKDAGAAGGLVGAISLSALIHRSSASVKVLGGVNWRTGGLVGDLGGTSVDPGGQVESSFATGTVITGDGGTAGGLVGSCDHGGSVMNAYATGTTQGGLNSTVGGLLGLNACDIRFSYASGAVESGSGNAVGGLIGNDTGDADLTDTDFDITTTGQSHGVGNNTGYPGVTGLTTEQFQEGLPDGFNIGIWAENADVNGGLPYLVALPPK